MTESINKWYILLGGFSGNDDEFTGGEYLCRLEAPANFPYEPPHFYFMTPNGVYDLEVKVCISVGEFHKKDYPAVLKMSGFAMQLVSGFIGYAELNGGIHLVTTTKEEKQRLAAQSREFNRTVHKDIIDLIEKHYAVYSAAWPK
jgi:ubiquitin-protein ligase